MVETGIHNELDAAVQEYLSWPKEKQEAVELLARSTRARELPFGVDGFKEFYWCIWRMELQPYAERDWVPYFANEEWVILECGRGTGKSTDLTISFNAYCLGKEPWTSSLIIQANDDAANDSAAAIAEIIETNSGWKACFPNIVPDKERGWGDKGYFINNTSEDYGKWREMCSRDHTKDPSFKGSGLGSTDIRGMHPRRIFIDDLHDINNSAFPTERAKVIKTVRANIIPTLMKPVVSGQKKPFIGVACTPWSSDDAYEELYGTGLFKRVVTPHYKKDPDGKYEIDGEKVSLLWEEGFPYDLVMQMKGLFLKKHSRTEWVREYLCDREAAKETQYRWYSYPADKIDLTMPMVGGVDYASVFLPTQAQEGGRSYFALAYLLKLPNGGAVIADGVVERFTQEEAEIKVMAAQNMFSGWQHVAVESNGEGRQFAQLLQRNPKMKVYPFPTSDAFRGKKEVRQWEILSPVLDRAALRISDADTPFLNTLRSYLENYPNIGKHDPEWDVADAVLWATFGAPELNISSGAIVENSPALDDCQEEETTSVWASLTRV